jgi:hypothetical protein
MTITITIKIHPNTQKQQKQPITNPNKISEYN